MVYALEKRAHSELTRQFENRLVKKTYLCIAHGAPDFEKTDVDAPLGVDPECRVRVAVNIGRRGEATPGGACEAWADVDAPACARAVEAARQRDGHGRRLRALRGRCAGGRRGGELSARAR